MGEVIYLDRGQSEIVSAVESLLDRAQQDDVECIILTEISAEGVLSYSRAGTILTAEDALKLIGSLEHHKAYLMGKLNEQVDAAGFEAEEEEDT